MSVIARHIVASPVRSASSTWAIITDLLAPNEGSARTALQSISGVASALIVSETPKDDPIVVWGEGPRIRIYCLFGEDAIAADDKDEDPFAKCPTIGDWHMSLPSSDEDLPWVEAELKQLATRVSARKLGEAVQDEQKTDRSSENLQINKDAFFRP
jgi:hypothetical protein